MTYLIYRNSTNSFSTEEIFHFLQFFDRKFYVKITRE